MTTDAQLCRLIKASIEKGDTARDKSENLYITAGRYLAELREGKTQKEFLALVHDRVGIGKTRTFELIGIANGTKTVEQIRANNAQKNRVEHRRSVRHDEQPTEPSDSRALTVVEHEDDQDGPDDILLADGKIFAKGGFTDDDCRGYAVYGYLRALNDDQRAEFLSPLFEDGLLPSPKKNFRAGTGDDEWFTPAKHVELAREVLGEIDLDPASCKQAQEIVRAGRYFTKEDDGLKQEWSGRVWVNPPYSQPGIALFTDKLVAEVKSGRVTAAIALTHNYTDTQWFRALASAASAMCFTTGRINFVAPANGKPARPAQGQTFYYFGNDVERFGGVFSDVGLVVVPLRSEVAPQSADDRTAGAKLYDLQRLNGALTSEIGDLQKELGDLRGQIALAQKAVKPAPMLKPAPPQTSVHCRVVSTPGAAPMMSVPATVLHAPGDSPVVVDDRGLERSTDREVIPEITNAPSLAPEQQPSDPTRSDHAPAPAQPPIVLEPPGDYGRAYREAKAHPAMSADALAKKLDIDFNVAVCARKDARRDQAATAKATA